MAIDLLPVFEKIDSFVRNLHFRVLRNEDEVGLVRHSDFAVVIAWDVAPGAAHVFNAAAGSTRYREDGATAKQ
jgi:hypothetical protein